MSCQIKITVIGHVDYRLLVADTVITDLKTVIILQCVGNRYLQVPRKAIFAIGTIVRKYNCIFSIFHICIPQNLMESVVKIRM